MNAMGTTLLTLDEVASRLGVHRHTVEKWVYDQKLDAFKIGDRKRGMRKVSEEALAKFVLLHTVRAKRPEWCTAAVETDFRAKLREMVRAEIATAEAQRRGEQIAA